MLVYNDLICGDTVLSDSFAQKPLTHNDAEIEGIFVVQASLVAKEIGNIDTGANASAEGGDEEVDDSIERVIDLKDPLIGFGYEGPQEIKASDFTLLFKGWCKKVKAKIEEKGDKPKPFMQSAKGFLDFLKAEFKNMEIYHPKSYNTETFILAWWDDEANTIGAPKFIFFKHALAEEKY